MLAMMRDGYQWAGAAPRHRAGVRASQAVLGAFLLLRAGLFLANMDLLFGALGFAPARSFSDPAGLLGHIFARGAAPICLGVLATSGALLISGRCTRLASLFAALALTVLRNRLVESMDAGDNFARVLLMYGALFLPPRAEAAPFSYKTWIHNMGVLLAGAQLCLVYFTAAVLKSGGAAWRHGTATYLVSQNELFMPTALRGFLANPLVTTATTYGMVLLQAWYPLALFSRLRRPWLASILLFHVFTIFGMKIVTFGLAMIGANLLLIFDEEYAIAAAGLRELRAAWRRRWVAHREALR